MTRILITSILGFAPVTAVVNASSMRLFVPLLIASIAALGCHHRDSTDIDAKLPLYECPPERAELLLNITLDKHQFGSEVWKIPLSRSPEYCGYSPPGLGMGHGHGTTKDGNWFYTNSQVRFEGSTSKNIRLKILCHVGIDDVDVVSFDETIEIPSASPSTSIPGKHVDVRCQFSAPNQSKK